MKAGLRWGLRALGVTLSAAALLAAVPAGCAGTTGGKRFSFDAAIAGMPREGAGPLTFTNQRGWTITLTKANVTLGPIYLNVATPLRATNGWLHGWIRSAYAHGDDHLGEGRVVGEVLAQVTFDALSPALVPFPARGTLVQEEIRTADIWFYPPPGVSPETTNIDTIAVDFAGEASRGADHVRFRGALKLDDTWLRAGTTGETQSITSVRQVRGIPAPMFPEEGGRLEVRFDVTRLFRGADFSSLGSNPTDPDGTKVLVQSKTGPVTTDQVMQNVHQGLKDVSGTYHIVWIQGG